jgi:hypothetical protein
MFLELITKSGASGNASTYMVDSESCGRGVVPETREANLDVLSEAMKYPERLDWMS